MNEVKNKQDKKFIEEIVNEVKQDFFNRQEERKHLERCWEIDMNFLSGNQYCDINYLGDIQEEDSRFFWQSKRVFNHIAPTIDSRLAKLIKQIPNLCVLPASDEENDIKTAKLSTSIIENEIESTNLKKVVWQATMWCETCGSAFYKIIWDNELGKKVGSADGEEIYEGDVKVVAISPFEIFPDSLSVENIEEANSIIHAKAISVDEIQKKYNVSIEGRDIDEFSLSPYSPTAHYKQGVAQPTRSIKHNHELVIERYEKPTKLYPNGRLIIVAGDKLLYYGELPYINSVEHRRTYPFVKQNCIDMAGSFFGVSIVERMIPIQRAYNAVKNRKHEFLNRLSMGVVTVEDGSLDVDDLVEEGLSPGKVLVYRQGATPPQMLNEGSIPSDFLAEEERLTNEFILISGTSELSRSSFTPSNVTSGTGLQLLLEQDEERLNVTCENMKNAVKEVGKQILRLVKQFVNNPRILKIAGKNSIVETFYYKGSDMGNEDVRVEIDNTNDDIATKRSMLYDMYKSGLLNDENGNISSKVRSKILEELGLDFIDNTSLTTMHIEKADRENLLLEDGEVEVSIIDDHNLHIEQHTKYLLSVEWENKAKMDVHFIEHIKKHKNLLKVSD